VSFEYLEYTLGEGSFFSRGKTVPLTRQFIYDYLEKARLFGKNAIILVKTRLFGRKSDYFGKKCDYL
jgi:hypothetical protein